MAALATLTPIAPRPITPSVLPGSSKPTNFFLPSSTAVCSALSSPASVWVKLHAGIRLRAAMSMPASTSSFTALALAPGALNTGTPRSLIALTGMLLVPAPARPMALTDFGISILCMSADRTSTASGVARDEATS
jgi:hypothetical protein